MRLCVKHDKRNINKLIFLKEMLQRMCQITFNFIFELNTHQIMYTFII